MRSPVFVPRTATSSNSHTTALLFYVASRSCRSGNDILIRLCCVQYYADTASILIRRMTDGAKFPCRLLVAYGFCTTLNSSRWFRQRKWMMTIMSLEKYLSPWIERSIVFQFSSPRSTSFLLFSFHPNF